ncbi:MAG: hypothetical protein QM790_01320 [Nibricoccus sp.]
MKRLIWVTASLVVAASLFYAGRACRSAREQRRQFATLQARSKKNVEEVTAAQARLSELRHQLENPPTEPRNDKSTVATPPQEQKSNRDVAELMEENPALRTLFRESTKANYLLGYKPFYDAAHLSPEQIERFEEIMFEAEQDKIDLRLAAKNQGLAPNDPSLKNLQRQNKAKLQEAQKELLGETGYEKLQRYQRLQPLSGFIQNIAVGAAQTDTPLTSQQCGQLLEILASANGSFQKGGNADYSTTDIPVALRKAEQIITPSQVIALRSSFTGIKLWKLKDQFYQQREAAKK